MSDSRFERLEDKMDKVKDNVDVILREQVIHSYRLNQYNEHLEEHMRRTKALEKQVGPIYLAKMSAGIGSALATILGVGYKVAKSLGYL